MTHYIPDSPRLGRSWCPGCDPNLDPTREILETSYCPTHKPELVGSEDAVVSLDGLLSGTGEADGHDCREMARLVRCPR